MIMNGFDEDLAIFEIPRDVLAAQGIDAADLEVRLAQPDKWIKLFIILTPLLWLTGALMPAAMLLLLWLLWRIPCRKYLTDWVVLSWWLVSGVQALCLFFNWMNSTQTTAFAIRQLFSFTTSGWFVLGAALAVGKYSRLNYKELARDASILGLYFIIFGIISFIVYLHFGNWVKFIASPVGLFLPQDLSLVRFYFTIRFYSMEYLFGKLLPRLALFYPWPLVLSFAGVGIFYMTLQEEKKLWRYIGITGAFVAILGSMGRMGVIALAVSLLVYGWGKMSQQAKWLTIPLVSALLVLTITFDVGGGALRHTFSDIETSREGSTEARLLDYQLTWQAIQKSPVIGYGWQGDIISEQIPMPLGSHSTILGVLYTGGALTFTFLCLAVIITLYSLLMKAVASGNVRRLSGLCIFLALTLFTTTEGINYFFISTLLILFWIGMAMSPLTEDQDKDQLILLV
jgi:hypothetical protein